jgi:hypothetical protein
MKLKALSAPRTLHEISQAIPRSRRNFLRTVTGAGAG